MLFNTARSFWSIFDSRGFRKCGTLCGDFFPSTPRRVAASKSAGEKQEQQMTIKVIFMYHSVHHFSFDIFLELSQSFVHPVNGRRKNN